MKFEKLFRRAKELGADYVVTGHYARIERDSSGRYLLKKAIDESKDQSYVLYSMTQEQLAHTLFPLGGLCKSEIRSIAAEQGFINADKRDSQDICFVQDGDYAAFIEKYTKTVYPHGDFIDTAGNVIGKHRGLIRYTVGQRKGLGVSFSKPMFVHSKNSADNTVTLCENEGLYSKSLVAEDFNWILPPPKSLQLSVKAKIRYNQVAEPAFASLSDNGNVYIEFERPQRAIAKGQAVVLYDGDIVVGGGVIS
jgi:tRNA-specific 2-thiouridylase